MIYTKCNLQMFSGKRTINFLILAIAFLFTAATEKNDSVLEAKNAALFSENVTIKGRVTDEDGNAILNVLIKIKDSSKGSKTDAAGVFELEGVPLKSVIVVSHPKFAVEDFKITKPKPYYRIVLKRK